MMTESFHGDRVSFEINGLTATVAQRRSSKRPFGSSKGRHRRSRLPEPNLVAAGLLGLVHRLVGVFDAPLICALGGAARQSSNQISFDASGTVREA